MILKGRAGEYTKLGSVSSFSPSPLPPSPPMELTPSLAILLSNADRALARLDGATLTLPNPELFVYSFMRQEAVLSSQIEGTQASLEDVFEYEAKEEEEAETDDITEVINYIRAMTTGIKELPNLPISKRLIKQLHSILLQEGRGAGRTPGEFRDNQNWIGPEGCSIERATFVPPAVPMMQEALSDWEAFINSTDETIPPLIKCALIHAQFETIHPFWDGNGRLGRMLVTLFLCEQKILSNPVLYLSLFFKSKRQQYYDHLQAVRDDGNWEAWVEFFLRGVEVTSTSALRAARNILELRERVLRITQEDMNSSKATQLGELLFNNMYVSINRVKKLLSVSYPTASRLVAEFEEADLLKKTKGDMRGRVYGFHPYIKILQQEISLLSSEE